MDRRTFLKATTVATVLAPSFARGQAAKPQFAFKWGCGLPASHPGITRGKEACAAIADQTGGRVQIALFPDNQLGGDSDMLAQVRSGGLDIYTAGATTIGPLVPIAGIITTAFAFPSEADGWKALDGQLGNIVRSAIDGVGLHTFERLWGQGFRQMTTKARPISSPGDLRGVKMRVPTSPMLLSLFKALGASPTSMNVNELYTALQTGLVEGQENPLSIIRTRNFNEVQKYCALTNHAWDVNIQVINRDTWEGVPDDLKTVIARNLNDAGLKQRDDVLSLNNSLQAELEKLGMVFNTPDIRPFRAQLKTAGFYNDWRKTFGEPAWAVLEQYTGPLV
jgi:tripartite ATP-independent transporter DctP family solute receptor